MWQNVALLSGVVTVTMWAGVQTQRIEDLFQRADAAEFREDRHGKLLYEIHGKVCSIERDIKNLYREKDSKKYEP